MKNINEERNLSDNEKIFEYLNKNIFQMLVESCLSIIKVNK